MTYEQIAANFQLWGEFFDTGAEMSEEEFNQLTIEVKVKMQKDAE
jgi:hypothetical protein